MGFGGECPWDPASIGTAKRAPCLIARQVWCGPVLVSVLVSFLVSVLGAVLVSVLDLVSVQIFVLAASWCSL